MGKATLSLSTNVFPPDSLIPCLECAAGLGLAGVELGPRNAVRLQESADECAGAERAYGRLGLRKLSIHAWTQVEGLGEVCPFVESFGGELIVVHSPPDKLAADFEGQVAALREWDAWCRERGVILTVENASMQLVGPFVELFRAVPGLRMTLDIKHAYKRDELGTTHVDFMRELAGRAANFHVSGIRRPQTELGDGTPPTDGDKVDWRAFGAELAGRGYAGRLTAELTLPRHLALEEMEPLYAELPPATPEWPELGHRLARYGISYFREAFAPVLAG